MINLNHYAESGEERFEWLLRWREQRQLVDAKRAFREIVECKVAIPQDLAETIAASLQVTEFKLTQGKQQVNAVETWIMIVEHEGLKYSLPDIFKKVAAEYNVAWRTVERNYYREYE